MKTKMMNSLTLLCLVTLASCGGGSGGGSKGKGTPSGTDGLNANISATFENWKKKPIKICSLKDAFGYVEPEMDDSGFGNSGWGDITPTKIEMEPGLDVSKLIRENGGSAIFNIGDEYITVNEMINLKGSTRNYAKEDDFEVELVRSGSNCSVSINGKEVFKTELAMGLVIRNHWVEKESTKSTSFEPGVKNILSTSDRTITVVAQKMNLTSEEAKKYLSLGENYNDHIYREKDFYTWSYLNGIIDWELKSAEIRMKAPELKGTDGVINTKDDGVLSFTVDYKSLYQTPKMFRLSLVNLMELSRLIWQQRKLVWPLITIAIAFAVFCTLVLSL
jgi:hypothetical protein